MFLERSPSEDWRKSWNQGWSLLYFSRLRVLLGFGVARKKIPTDKRKFSGLYCCCQQACYSCAKIPSQITCNLILLVSDCKTDYNRKLLQIQFYWVLLLKKCGLLFDLPFFPGANNDWQGTLVCMTIFYYPKSKRPKFNLSENLKYVGSEMCWIHNCNRSLKIQG